MNLGQQKLIQYLEDRPSLSQAAFADVIGCGRAYVNRMIKGTAKPARELSSMIWIVTKEIETGDWDKESE